LHENDSFIVCSLFVWPAACLLGAACLEMAHSLSVWAQQNVAPPTLSPSWRPKPQQQPQQPQQPQPRSQPQRKELKWNEIKLIGMKGNPSEWRGINNKTNGMIWHHMKWAQHSGQSHNSSHSQGHSQGHNHNTKMWKEVRPNW
jgi:hypothetical protein